MIKDRGKFIPEDRGRLVVILNNFFSRYVEYDFTKLEGQLDAVSDGKLNWKDLLAQFWRDFKAAIDNTSDLTILMSSTSLMKTLAHTSSRRMTVAS